MLFNSLSFAAFLPIVFYLHWFISKSKVAYQNICLLLASYFFYSCWDWIFLFLLIFSTFLDYYTGISIEKAKNLRIKKIWLYISIIINIGILVAFKYYNFFSNSFAEVLNSLGFKTNFFVLDILLPIGISFYTFHGVSYIVDVYKNRIASEKNFITYALFVSFFPLLVAGPIERAQHLLPQLKKKRIFHYNNAVNGLRQILWGVFKKVVIADNCAEIADAIFNNSANYSGSVLILGAFFFAFQIYGDFSGYSDIALGTARLFGIQLLQNFSFPYFSRNVAEFWRRWHISLFNWFRDYIYIPLGGSRGNVWKNIRNTLIIFVISGIWHGANWTFIVCGVLNTIFLLPAILSKNNRETTAIVAQNTFLPSIKESIGMIMTFILTLVTWIVFRAENVPHAFTYITNIFSESLFSIPRVDGIRQKRILLVLIFTIVFMIIEWLGRQSNFAIENFILKWSKPYRYIFYYIIIFMIMLFAIENKSYIYFQF